MVLHRFPTVLQWFYGIFLWFTGVYRAFTGCLQALFLPNRQVSNSKTDLEGTPQFSYNSEFDGLSLYLTQ